MTRDEPFRLKSGATTKEFPKWLFEQDVICVENVVYVKNTAGLYDRLRIKRHLIDHDFSPIQVYDPEAIEMRREQED